MSEAWNQETLEEACEITYGERVIKKRDAGTAFPVYGGGGETFRIDRFNREDCTIVSRFGMSAFCVRNVAGKFFLNDSGLSVRPKNPAKLLPRFLDYFLYASQRKIYSLGRGSAQKNLDVKAFRRLEIGCPGSLPEQKRIVAILDETFAGIDTAIANTEKNLANARELFNSYLNSVFSQQGEGWTVETLDQICVIARGGSPRPIKAYLTDESGGVNWIKISDATASSKFVYETKQKIRPEGVKKSRMVHAGDLLLSNSMSFGRPYIMRTSGCIHDGWLVLSNKVDAYETNYLYYFLGSPEAYSQFDLRASGSTVRNLNIDLVRSVKVPIPPLPEQARIAANIEELEIEAQRLEAIYQQKLTALAELKQSLLQKAFAGELTADSAEAVDRVEAALA
jgi:type I restriction enzyme S subunit